VLRTCRVIGGVHRAIRQPAAVLVGRPVERLGKNLDVEKQFGPVVVYAPQATPGQQRDLARNGGDLGWELTELPIWTEVSTVQYAGEIDGKRTRHEGLQA
jgi:hypothetical protein